MHTYDETVATYACNRCKAVYYCNAKCQKSMYSTHKTVCKKTHCPDGFTQKMYDYCGLFVDNEICTYWTWPSKDQITRAMHDDILRRVICFRLQNNLEPPRKKGAWSPYTVYSIHANTAIQLFWYGILSPLMLRQLCDHLRDDLGVVDIIEHAAGNGSGKAMFKAFGGWTDAHYTACDILEDDYDHLRDSVFDTVLKVDGTDASQWPRVSQPEHTLLFLSWPDKPNGGHDTDTPGHNIAEPILKIAHRLLIRYVLLATESSASLHPATETALDNASMGWKRVQLPAGVNQQFAYGAYDIVTHIRLYERSGM
jgi:hypothetical protein